MRCESPILKRFSIDLWHARTPLTIVHAQFPMESRPKNALRVRVVVYNVVTGFERVKRLFSAYYIGPHNHDLEHLPRNHLRTTGAPCSPSKLDMGTRMVWYRLEWSVWCQESIWGPLEPPVSTYHVYPPNSTWVRTRMVWYRLEWSVWYHAVPKYKEHFYVILLYQRTLYFGAVVYNLPPTGPTKHPWYTHAHTLTTSTNMNIKYYAARVPSDNYSYKSLAINWAFSQV